MISLVSSPSHHSVYDHVQSCTVCKIGGRRPGPFYHTNDINFHPDRQSGDKCSTGKMYFTHKFFVMSNKLHIFYFMNIGTLVWNVLCFKIQCLKINGKDRFKVSILVNWIIFWIYYWILQWASLGFGWNPYHQIDFSYLYQWIVWASPSFPLNFKALNFETKYIPYTQALKQKL